MASFTQKTASTAKVSTNTDLLELYAQIEYATTPFETLGLPLSGSSELKDIRAAYHAIARRIHPDKCQPCQVDLHTHHFKRVQRAYEQLKSQQSEPIKEQKTPTRKPSRAKTSSENERPTSRPGHSPGAQFSAEHRPSPPPDTEHGRGTAYDTGDRSSANSVPSPRVNTSRAVYARPIPNAAWSSEELCEDL